jgi:O-antigen/teichoic acid export membrane protein
MQTLLTLLKNRRSQLWTVDMATRGWLAILAGTMIRVALSFLGGIFIVRTLGPTDFGIYSLLTAVIGIAGVVVDLGLTEAAVKKIAAYWAGDRSEALKQAQTFFWLRLGLAGLGMGVGLLLAWPISRYLLQLPDNGLLFSLALLGMGATTLSGSVNAILQATNHFTRIAVALVGSTALTLVMTILLALIGQLNLVTALLVGGVGTALAGFWWSYRLLPREWGAGTASPLHFPGSSILRAEAPGIFRFGGWLWLANICKVLIAYLDIFLVNLWLSPAIVGFYALALGLAARTEMVNHSLYTVLIPMASALKGRQAVGAYLKQGFKRSALISLLLLPALPLARWFIPFFYGPEYLPSIFLFQLLLGVVIFDIFTLPALLLIYTFDRPDLSALAEGLRVAILVLLAAWLIPTMGPIGAIIAKFCAKLVGVVITLVLLFQHSSRHEKNLNHKEHKDYTKNTKIF